MTYNTQIHVFGTSYEHTGPLAFFGAMATMGVLLTVPSVMVGLATHRLCGNYWVGALGCFAALTLSTMRVNFSQV